MKISVLVKTKSKIESVEKQNDGSYVVRVHAPPVDGQANERICELLAKHFGRPKSSIEIVSGLKGKKKTINLK